jgi:serine/threonine-protein kinase
MTKGDKNIVGQILAKTYRIERFLGAGTIGTVYVARHVRSGGLYAVKVLHKKLAASPEVYQRFQDEARLIATLRHPHIHPITDFDRDDSGLPFFVMELLEGETLAQRLKNRETLPIPQLVEVVQQVGSALHTAHRSGIVHRNLKPENIFLVRHDLGDRVTESAKVMDFGLSRFRLRAAAAGPSPGPRDTAVHVTDFMAPELLREGEAAPDGRADQWALAVIAFKALSGKLPFEDDTPEETQRRILNEPPRPLNKLLPDLPAHVVAAINRGMAKRREDRYETTLDFVRAVCSKAPTLAGGDAGDGVPQARVIPPSGRIAAPMPPMPSAPMRAASTPPAMPRVTPPAIPATPPQRPTPVAVPTPPPVAPTPPAPVPAAPSPSTESGPAAGPRLLTPPPLLLTETAPAPAPTPSRGPSMAVIVGGGALALLVGLGATVLWVQRKPAPNVEVPAPVVNTPPAKPVVEALDAFTAQPAPGPSTAPDAGRDMAGIPPLRGAGTGELTTAPLAPPPTAGKPAEPPGTLPVTPPATTGTPGATGAPPPAAAPSRPPGAGPDSAIKLNPPGSPSGNLLFKPSSGGAPAATGPTGSEPTAPAARPAEPSEPAGASAGSTEAPDKTGDKPGEKTPEDIMRDAQTAYVRGERQRAIELALQVAERGGPSAAGAWRFLGSAACSIRNAAIASRAYNSLSSPDHKQMVVELCQRNGLALQNGQFVSSE